MCGTTHAPPGEPQLQHLPLCPPPSTCMRVRTRRGIAPQRRQVGLQAGGGEVQRLLHRAHAAVEPGFDGWGHQVGHVCVGGVAATAQTVGGRCECGWGVGDGCELVVPCLQLHHLAACSTPPPLSKSPPSPFPPPPPTHQTGGFQRWWRPQLTRVPGPCSWAHAGTEWSACRPSCSARTRACRAGEQGRAAGLGGWVGGCVVEVTPTPAAVCHALPCAPCLRRSQPASPASPLQPHSRVHACALT